MTTLENITRQIKENGFANYKASVIVPSKKLAGWFHNKKETVFAPSLSELIFDLDDEQINIDYDANVKASKELLNAFVNFKEAL